MRLGGASGGTPLFQSYQEDGREQAPLILVIDDASDSMRLVMSILQSAGYRTLSAERGATGIPMAEQYNPNAILLDIQMPEMDGWKVCRALKSRLSTSDTPVIFLTGLEETDEVIAKSYDAGAHDLIFKPIGKVNLLARLRVVLEEQMLRESYRQLAIKDSQTGLDNRGQFFLQLTDAVTSSKRDKTSAFLILGVVDNWAVATERFGHAFGDEVMLTLARLMKRLDSSDSHAGRVAGDTLAVVMKNSDEQRALGVCERIRKTFAAIAFDAETDPKHFTASFGIAGFDGDDADYDPDTMMSEADVALCVAKDRGRGTSQAFWDMDPEAVRAISPEKRQARREVRRATHRAFITGDADDQPRDADTAH